MLFAAHLRNINNTIHFFSRAYKYKFKTNRKKCYGIYRSYDFATGHTECVVRVCREICL